MMSVSGAESGDNKGVDFLLKVQLKLCMIVTEMLLHE